MKESDRVSILRLHRCKSDGKYCEERRVLKLQDELQPVTMEILATETAIAYVAFAEFSCICTQDRVRDAFDLAFRSRHTGLCLSAAHSNCLSFSLVFTPTSS